MTDIPLTDIPDHIAGDWQRTEANAATHYIVLRNNDVYAGGIAHSAIRWVNGRTKDDRMEIWDRDRLDTKLDNYLGDGRYDNPSEIRIIPVVAKVYEKKAKLIARQQELQAQVDKLKIEIEEA